MVVPRATIFSRGLTRTVLRRSGPAARARSWKQAGRRGYASGHGEQQSSELPWIIGSVAVTVPAAGWLLQQGPTKSDHGHGHGHDDDHKEEKEEPEEKEGGDESSEEATDDDAEEKKDDKDEESKDEPEQDDETKDKEENSDENKQDDKDEKDDEDDSKDESDSPKKSKSSKGGESSDDYPPPSPDAPGQINYKAGSGKGPGEGQKGERKPSERKGEKDSQGSHSGAKHPYIDDPEKSKKGVGVTETAKIHGTVDSSQPSR